MSHSLMDSGNSGENVYLLELYDDHGTNGTRPVHRKIYFSWPMVLVTLTIWWGLNLFPRPPEGLTFLVRHIMYGPC
jgi:hypothetical protein